MVSDQQHSPGVSVRFHDGSIGRGAITSGGVLGIDGLRRQQPRW